MGDSPYMGRSGEIEMGQQYDAKTLAHWVEVCQTSGKNLTAWEDEFLESLRLSLERGKTLTSNQVDILDRIYAEKTP